MRRSAFKLNDDRGAAEWRAHWPVVAVSMLATTFPILYLYATGGMIAQIQNELGWTRTQVSSGPAIVAFAAVVLAPLVGSLIDRFGARAIALPGAAFYLASVAGLALASPSPWIWWLLWAIVALGAAAASPAVWTTGVSSLFFSSRGLALAVTLTGTGLGSIIVPKATQALSAEFGWRGAYVALAALWCVILVPIFLFFHSAKDKMKRGSAQVVAADALSGLSAREAILSVRFAKLMAGACGIGLICNGMAVNMVPILVDFGKTAPAAATLAGLVGIGSIIGRILGGILLDRVRGTIVGASAGLILCLSTALFATFPGWAPAVLIGVFCVGLTVGVEYDAIAYLASRYFGMKAFGTVFGALSGMTVLMSGLGPLLTSFIFDVSGGYRPALWAFVPLALVSALFFLTLGPYPEIAVADGEDALGAGPRQTPAESN